MKPDLPLLSGTITDLAFGGEGILRHENRVIFVPFTAPGDEITCQLTQQKKNFARADYVDITKPSPERIPPLCPYFGTCGGCQLQHVNYPTQLKEKHKWVHDSLKRIGELNVEVNFTIPASQQWAYRRHIHLTLRSKNHFFEAGYIATDHRSLLSIQHCPIFLPLEETLLTEVHSFVQQISSKGNEEGKLTLLKQPHDKFFLHFHFKYLPQNIEELIKETASQRPQWQTIVVSSIHKTLVFGQKYAQTVIEGLEFCYSARAFMQNHPEQSVNIYKQILSIVEKSRPQHILDLYCGIGISSLLLVKKGYTVTGVELNREAFQLAKLNAKNNQLSQATFIEADVKEVLPALLKKHDCVIINPPREGLDPEVIETLLKSPVKELIYISCMPSTLARDLKKLSEKYQIITCQPYDMFPQTAHVETLVYLKALSSLSEG